MRRNWNTSQQQQQQQQQQQVRRRRTTTTTFTLIDRDSRGEKPSSLLLYTVPCTVHSPPSFQLAYLVRLSGLSWRDVPTAMTKMLGEATLAFLGAALFSAVNPRIDANQLIRTLKTLL